MQRHTGGAARVTVLLLIVTIQAVGGAALAQSELELAESAYDAGQLDDASDQLQAALRSGGLGAEQIARVYRLVGVLAVADGQSGAALAAFQTSLALNPEQTTPPELGPEQAARFDEAREARVAALFELTAEHDVIIRDAPVAIRIHSANPPANLVTTYRISATAPGAAPWTADDAATSGEVVLDAMAWRGAEMLTVAVSARDRFGNTVAACALELHAPARPSVPVEPVIGIPDEPAVAAPPPSRRGRRIALAIAGVALVGAAAGIGVWLARRPVSGQFVLSN